VNELLNHEATVGIDHFCTIKGGYGHHPAREERQGSGEHWMRDCSVPDELHKRDEQSLHEKYG
jgi:hypothetical protein